MSAVDEIQAAIEKLSRQRDAAEEGPWMHLDSGDVVMGDGSDFVEAYPLIAACGNHGDADLIETLHATIDAQLAFLGEGIRFGGITPNIVTLAALDLARAINGGTK